jgi:hypothetical protein
MIKSARKMHEESSQARGGAMKNKLLARVKKAGQHKGETPSRLIDARIRELGDWRGEMLSRIRALIKQADPGVVEEWKWRGVPVWSHRRDVQERREDDLRQGSIPEGPFAPL